MLGNGLGKRIFFLLKINKIARNIRWREFTASSGLRGLVPVNLVPKITIIHNTKSRKANVPYSKYAKITIKNEKENGNS